MQNDSITVTIEGRNYSVIRGTSLEKIKMISAAKTRQLCSRIREQRNTGVDASCYRGPQYFIYRPSSADGVRIYQRSHLCWQSFNDIFLMRL